MVLCQGQPLQNHFFKKIDKFLKKFDSFLRNRPTFPVSLIVKPIFTFSSGVPKTRSETILGSNQTPARLLWNDHQFSQSIIDVQRRHEQIRNQHEILHRYMH